MLRIAEGEDKILDSGVNSNSEPEERTEMYVRGRSIHSYPWAQGF